MGSQCGAHRSRANPYFLLHAAERAAVVTGGGQAPVSISQPSLRPTPRSGISSTTHLLPASTLGPALALAAEPLENVTLSALAGRQEGPRSSACTCVPSDTFPFHAQRRHRHAGSRAPRHIPAGLHMCPHACTPRLYQRQALACALMHKAYTCLPQLCSLTCMCMWSTDTFPRANTFSIQAHTYEHVCSRHSQRGTQYMCVCPLRYACGHELTAPCTHS